MKTLTVEINEADFEKYGLQKELLSFDELLEKIRPALNSTHKKAKFKDTPAYNLWKDREDMADVDEYVSQLRKPRQQNVS